MTPEPDGISPVAHSLWTIARIQDVLTSPDLIRRFLLDITHAPGHRVMEVFTAWQAVAATIEDHASQGLSSETAGEPLLAQQPDLTANLHPRRPAAPAPE